jgi:hypothetical protein
MALSLCVIVLLGAAASPSARTDLNVNVVNKSGIDPSQVFIMFGAAPPPGYGDHQWQSEDSNCPRSLL